MQGFDWDEGNIDKNWQRHEVTSKECEGIFFSEPLITFEDIKHSKSEKRFGVIGQTEKGRILQVIYIVRGGKIRIISARDANRRERKYYESIEK